MLVDRSVPIVCTDLDYTLVDHEDLSHAALRAVQKRSKEAPFILIYNSGRSRTSINDLYAEPVKLEPPHYMITGVGTQIFAKDGGAFASWNKHLNSSGWNKGEIEQLLRKLAPQLEWQLEHEQNPFKISLFVEKQDMVDVLSANLQQAGFGPDKVSIVYSGKRFLDLIPACAGKGKALQFLLETLAKEINTSYEDLASRTICCGDSGNDIDMFKIDGIHGCIVGNADADLLKWLGTLSPRSRGRIRHYPESRCAYSILQALDHVETSRNK